MAANPLGSTVDDNVGTMGDGTAEEASSTECVVNLNESQLQSLHLQYQWL